MIARTESKAMIRRFGDPVIPATRSSLMDVLTALLPSDAFRLGVAATGVGAGGPGQRPRLLTDSGPLEADLIVAADGVNAVLRKALFAELLRRFGGWHFPVPQLISAAAPETVLHNDIYEIATSLPPITTVRSPSSATPRTP